MSGRVPLGRSDYFGRNSPYCPRAGGSLAPFRREVGTLERSVICEVCGGAPVERHHWLSRKRWGRASEVDDNVIMLCADCHRLGPHAVHRIGIDSFAARFGLTEDVEKAREAVYGKARENEAVGV